VSYLEARFQQTLGSLLSSAQRKTMLTVWLLDNAGQVTMSMAGNIKGLVSDVILQREQLGHIDHVILERLQTINQRDAVTFLLNGGCRSEPQLSNPAVLQLVMKVFSSSSEKRGLFLNYMKENETAISDECYRRTFTEYVKLNILENTLQENIF
jgi:hypothetical protein